jgi:hypothetical protein
MKSTSEPAFTIVDKRGQNRASEEAPAQPEAHPAISPQDSKNWKSWAFRFDTVQTGPQQFGTICRAVGLRKDGKTFKADMLIHPLDINDGVDWRVTCKKRLDTFLGCQCSIARGECSVHKISIPQWVQTDMKRYMIVSQRPIPEAMEILHKEEMARASVNLVLPR